MTKFTLIDFDRTKDPIPKEDISFKIKDGIDNRFFICEVCFKQLKTRNLKHLEKCNGYWPYRHCSKCYSRGSYRIYEVSKEGHKLNRKIVNAIEKLGRFSRIEQGLDCQITTRGLLGKSRYPNFEQTSEHQLYVTFFYKKIIAYCLVETYSSAFYQQVIIRDLYVLPPYRGKKESLRLLEQIAKRKQIELPELIYSRPVTRGVRKVLKHKGQKNIQTIQGERIKTMKSERL